MPVSQTANILMLRCGNFLELPKIQSEVGFVQMLTTLPRSQLCNWQLRAVRVLKKGEGAWETSTQKASQDH